MARQCHLRRHKSGDAGIIQGMAGGGGPEGAAAPGFCGQVKTGKEAERAAQPDIQSHGPVAVRNSRVAAGMVVPRKE